MPEDVNNAAETSAAAAQPIHYDSWDEKGNPIVSKPAPKTEEAAASATPAKPAESASKDETAAEPEAATEPQEKTKARKPGEKLSAGEELAKLRRELREATDRAERLERERSRAPEPKPAGTEAKQAQAPQTYAEWRKQFKPTAWMEQFSKENPQSNYDDALAACSEYLSEARDQFKQYEQQQAAIMAKTKSMVDKTLERYPDAKEKTTLAVTELRAAPSFVHAFIGDSEVGSDLLYALSDSATLKNLLETAQAAPGKAIRVLRDMEVEIEKEISKSSAAVETEPKPPVEKKPRAPEPPTVVGGKGAAAEDAAVAAARSGDFRAFEAEQNRRRFSSHK